jgi:hypothetical protein
MNDPIDGVVFPKTGTLYRSLDCLHRERDRLSKTYTADGQMWSVLTLQGLSRRIEDPATVSPLHLAYGRLLLRNTSTKLESPRKLGTIFKREKQEALYQEALRQTS